MEKDEVDALLAFCSRAFWVGGIIAVVVVLVLYVLSRTV